MNILVLDDDKSRLTCFKTTNIGHYVVCVSEPEEAIEQLKSRQWDLVSLDHDLYGTQFAPSDERSGWWVAKYISENPPQAPLLVVFHSLNGDGRAEMLKKLPDAIVMPGAWLIPFFDEEGNLNKAYGGTGSEDGMNFLI